MSTADLTGAEWTTVERALRDGDPLPGTAGFAGALDGRLVRDVLGRYPLFSERADPTVWSHDPDDIEEPRRLPPGSVRDDTGTRDRWTLPDPAPTDDPEQAVDALGEALDATLSAIDAPGLAVAFSGGVDSALLAARLDAPVYTVGFPDSHDLGAARSAARLLDADLRVVELDHGTLERAVPAVARVTGRTDAMDVQIALPLFVLAERVREDGFDRLAVGQGADELFGGYAKVASAPDDDRVAADTVRGARREVLDALPPQLERDWLAIRSRGVTPVTPLVHDRVVEAALSLSGPLLVTADGERKHAFRRAARTWLPAEIADRDKKALQYGSLVARELDRLARQAGFKRRMDDHVTRYVRARCDSP